MDFATLLWCVVGIAGYWGQYFARRGRVQHGFMLLGCAAAAGIGLGGVPVAGAIGIGGAACILVLAPMLRGTARVLVRREQFGAAQRLLSIAALLAPGAGAEEDRVGVAMLASVRSEGVGVAVAALERAKRQLPSANDVARRTIDERIVLLYTAVGQWQDAVDHAHRQLDVPTAVDVVAADQSDGLGQISPVVWVELLGAQARLGEVAAALVMYQRFAHAIAALPSARQANLVLLQHRARLLLLANAGRRTLLLQQLALTPKHHIAPAQSAYLRAVAAFRAGDDTAGDTALTLARRLVRHDSRQLALIDSAAAILRGQALQLAPALSADIDAIVVPLLTLPTRPVAPRLVVAPVLIGACVAWFAFQHFAIAAGDDATGYIRAGAIAVGLVDEGQWWRCASSLFVHIGVSHLLLNCIAIWVIGRVAETMFGRVRTLAAFFVGGTVGAVASYLSMAAGIAAGASGGALGMLGAVVAELVLHRERYSDAWRRGVSGVLVVVGLAQFAADFAMHGGVHWAHLAGWLAGGVVGAALSNQGRWQPARSWAARLLVVAALAATAWASVAVAGQDLSALYLARPTQSVTQSGLTFRVPMAARVSATMISDDDFDIAWHVSQAHDTAPAMALAQWIAHEEQAASEQQLILRNEAQRLAMPAPWLISEYLALDGDGRGTGRRLIVFATTLDAETTVVGSIYVSDWFAGQAPAVLQQWLQSIGRTPT